MTTAIMFPPSHFDVEAGTPSPTPSPTPSDDQQQGPRLPAFLKSAARLPWKAAGGVLAFLVVVGWIFIIVVLILEEKWQLVLVAWLLLYSAAHFCYWYCKRHSFFALHNRLRLRVAVSQVEKPSAAPDAPPTYDECMSSEAPPPAYFSVVQEPGSSPSVRPRDTHLLPPPYQSPKLRSLSVGASPLSSEDLTPPTLDVSSNVEIIPSPISSPCPSPLPSPRPSFSFPQSPYAPSSPCPSPLPSPCPSFSFTPFAPSSPLPSSAYPEGTSTSIMPECPEGHITERH